MSTDPIYAMIERHKAASAAYSVACDRPDYAQVVEATQEAIDLVTETGHATDDAIKRRSLFPQKMGKEAGGGIATAFLKGDGKKTSTPAPDCP